MNVFSKRISNCVTTIDTHPDPIMQAMAEKIAGYKQQFQEGALTKDEYDDLVDDATTLDDVSRAGKTLEELVMLDRAIGVLKEISSYLPIP